MIRDDAAAAEVYEGPQGFLATPLEGRLFVEMSTLRPATIARLDAVLRARGAALVDAPVSGTVGPARDGKLLALAGARPEDRARARPRTSRARDRSSTCCAAAWCTPARSARVRC
jgi:3-hydroxyisobutyrate dehydrogenase-like beta-hydroxyacid dehydrogenase